MLWKRWQVGGQLSGSIERFWGMETWTMTIVRETVFVSSGGRGALCVIAVAVSAAAKLAFRIGLQQLRLAVPLRKGYEIGFGYPPSFQLC